MTLNLKIIKSDQTNNTIFHHIFVVRALYVTANLAFFGMPAFPKLFTVFDCFILLRLMYLLFGLM